MSDRLLIVTGLQHEARQAACIGTATVCSGGDVALLARRLDALDARDFRGVISFGLAGGLDPTLSPGDLAVGLAVVMANEGFETDPALTGAVQRALRAAGLSCAYGAFAGADAPVLTPAAKADLRLKTGAVAVDVESHVVARWAAERRLPFAILRTISDPAHRALPPLATSALTPDGRIAYRQVIASLARDPGQIGAMLAAGQDSRAGFAALDRCWRTFFWRLNANQAVMNQV